MGMVFFRYELGRVTCAFCPGCMAPKGLAFSVTFDLVRSGGPDGVPGWPYLLYSTLLACLSVCLFWAGCMWETGRGVAKLGFEGLLGHVGCENATCGWWVGGCVCQRLVMKGCCMYL